MTFSIIEFLERKREFSLKTFGPIGYYTSEAILAHVKKEIVEIEAEPNDLEEWIDLVHLALDGAWRAGYTPEQVVEMLVHKQVKNEARDWPNWRNATFGEPIEHIEVKEIKLDCQYFSYQKDRNGDVAISHCHHVDNPYDTEGNCSQENCPLCEVEIK